MVDWLMDVLLSKWIVFILLLVAFLFVSRWGLRRLKEYVGYALGWLLALFVLLVYVSLGGGNNETVGTTEETLSIFQVFLATLLGVGFGSAVMVGLRYGMRYARGVALQVAVYTSLNLILLFLVLIEGALAARMIGIFGLAFAIVTLFAVVMFPSRKNTDTPQPMPWRERQAQDNPPLDNNPPNPREDARRRSMGDRNLRR